MTWAPGSIWKVFKVARAGFEKFGVGLVSWGVLTSPEAVRSLRGGLIGPGRRFDHPGQCEQSLFFPFFPMLHCCIGSRECDLAQGEFAYVQGKLVCEFVVRGLVFHW
jgi:hypothetical protein